VTEACAPGKVILFGEHAVVYGRPAIAVPVNQVQAVASVEPGRDDPGVTVCATDIGCIWDVASAPLDEPLSLTVRNTLSHIGVDLQDVRLVITIRSSIPVASGLGSGAAVATALVRALSAHLACPIDDAVVSSIVYETEKIHHGTPSGIDNTVVSFGQPVYFQRGHPIALFEVKQPFWLAIADTGVPSLTRAAVADVRVAWERDRAQVERTFDQIAAVVDAARLAIEEKGADGLGALMDQNQRLLRALQVSSVELERLIEAALRAGAWGAKLSGGGRGGNMIAAIAPDRAGVVSDALYAAGARNVIVTQVE
jgi:mevalonate kinase